MKDIAKVNRKLYMASLADGGGMSAKIAAAIENIIGTRDKRTSWRNKR